MLSRLRSGRVEASATSEPLADPSTRPLRSRLSMRSWNETNGEKSRSDRAATTPTLPLASLPLRHTIGQCRRDREWHEGRDIAVKGGNLPDQGRGDVASP